jgi:hypothetical protein
MRDCLHCSQPRELRALTSQQSAAVLWREEGAVRRQPVGRRRVLEAAGTAVAVAAVLLPAF